MPALKYLAALWIALLFYAVSSLLIGAMGLFAYEQLNVEKEKLFDNLHRLQILNEEFTGIQNALVNDNDTIYLHARELGYGDSGEHFIRIVGLPGKNKNRVSAGELLIPAAPEYVDDKTLRIISIAIALSMILCIGIVDLLRLVKNS
ncbi:MAG: septum formation initiator family protein [Spirochaetaceae bacterium]|jgi:cell division protein FtsB|nr:septum formation initiator family protein [Spirochaetaceae bacterium]